MFVLRCSSEEMKMLEVVLDYYLSVFPFVDVHELKHKVICSEYYDDKNFSIVWNKLFEDYDF